MRIFIVFALLVSSIYAKSIFSNNEQVETSKYIGALKDLVIATQKTRGLTNSYLNGNESTLLLIYGNKKEMKKAIGIMESLSLSSDPVINARASNITSALIKHNNKAFKMEPSVAFAKYTELIEQVLMLAQTVSRHSSKELNPFGKDVSIVMMEVLLPFTEYVGQLRGMGSGIVAKGTITKSQLNKMSVIMSEVESLNAKLQADMSAILVNNRDKFKSTNIEAKLLAIQKATTAYMSHTKTEVFKKNITIDPNAYFDQGTDLISLIVDVFQADNQAILEDSKGWL